MAITIDQAFIKQFEREVHEAYQRMGSKLRGAVRAKTGVQGSSAIFQKVGRGQASTKARNGMVPTMNVDHSSIEVILQDFYAGDWVDKLDELKISIDERQVIANAGAYALGRKTDELIITELNTSTNFALTNTDGLTKAKVLRAFEMLGNADVPDDGQRFAVVGYKQWSDLLQIPEFADSDFIGPDDLPWKGTQAKNWMGTLWMPHSGLSVASNVRTCHWFHKTAVGHAIGAEVETDITWHGDRASFFVNNMMSQGAKVIDTTGIVTMRCLES